ncbi:MAG: glutamate synthase [bacterium]|nr:glutamate synthase [bacterium]
MRIEAGDMHFQALNEQIHASADDAIEIVGCMGQRYIASGLKGKSIAIHGIPGNALCAYLNDCRVEVFGNAQDATGDTMNAGTLIVHGSCGDATGYAMRGGTILVKGNVGYRAGIHMKAYQEQVPVLVIGGEAGSFLGEYQAGGYIVVLGLNTRDRAPVGRFCAAGMHGGKIYLRTEAEMPFDLPQQVVAREANEADMQEIQPYLTKYAEAFGADASMLMKDRYMVLEPNTSNPYMRLYVTN